MSIAEYFFTIGNDKRKSLVYTARTQKVLSVATACTVATKAPPGRATGASAKAAIHFQNRAVSKGLSIFEKRITYGSVLFSRRLPVFNSRALCPTIAYGGCFAALILHNRRVALLTSKEVLITIIRTPVRGQVGCRVAISSQRKVHVASDQALSGRPGVVAHDRSAKATSSVSAGQ